MTDDQKRQEFAKQAAEKGLTVKALEHAIKKSKAPQEGQKKRGVKPLPPAAKKFSPIASSAPAALEGLTEKKARELFDQAQALKALVQDWLPAFEAELARIGKIQAGPDSEPAP